MNNLIKRPVLISRNKLVSVLSKCQPALALRPVSQSIIRQYSEDVGSHSKSELKKLHKLYEKFYLENDSKLESDSEINYNAEMVSETKSTETIPWYMRKKSENAARQQEVKIQKYMPAILPENAPAELKPLLKFMISELGVEDIKVFDLRNNEEPMAFGGNSITILANGKSDRHLIKAGLGLHKWVKETYEVVPYTEGIIRKGAMLLTQRRLKKKAKKALRGPDSAEVLAAPSSEWILLETKLSGISVHFLSAEKRQELDLESLWQKEQERLIEDSQTEENLSAIYTPKNKKPSWDSNSKRSYHTFSRTLNQDQSIRSYSTDNSSIFSSNITKDNKQIFDDLKTATLEGDYKRALCLHKALPCDFVQDGQLAEYLAMKSLINFTTTHIDASRSLLSGTKEEISEFLKLFQNLFPINPTLVHWRLALQFLIACHEVNYQAFPASVFVDQLTIQQASGSPVSLDDILIVINELIKSPEFGGAIWEGSKSSAAWTQVCDKRFRIIQGLVDNIISLGALPFFKKEIILTLLFRLCIQNSSEIKTPQTIINFSDINLDGTSINQGSQSTQDVLSRVPIDKRALAVLDMIGQNNTDMTISFLVLAFSGLANAQHWSRFWKLWREVVLANVDVNGFLIELISGLVASSGQGHAISHFLGNEWIQMGKQMGGSISITPNLAHNLTQCLSIIDPNGNCYRDLRSQLSQ
ncbi:hypothetical protein NADFUDRAFT_76206 [Nadsonia fulvescens var. elongata DSM 6958]|uniref:ATPase synthesis protein 25 n=1 Tax=Nadsonia fulvescens var. elongata DSM 6958 TaxID=857566 RepID=A0A1E3PS91_9ASCO|nr:hypothetical protein NADFUDRAFT_76206 [Nadsonia fulvescens var. elongata DSM 6958]